MTRHGIIQRSAAGYRPPATDPRAPVMIIVADIATFSRWPGRQHRVEAQLSCLSAPIHALPGQASAFADISGKSKSP